MLHVHHDGAKELAWPWGREQFITLWYDEDGKIAFLEMGFRMTADLRWGILGCASIAARVGPAIASVPGNRLAAVSSRSLSKARAAADAFGVEHAFGSYAEMLASGTIDVVYNPLPNSLHAEWTIAALAAGLPVLCEKPLTATAAEARAVLAASKRTGLLVAEAFMYRHHPLYDVLAKLLADGAIGHVRVVSATFTFLLDDRNETPASAALAGGSLRDVGCYPVSLARMVLRQEPKRAFAMARFSDVDDTLTGLLEFPGGAIAQVTSSIESHERAHAEIIGTTGTIFLESPWFPGEELLLVRGGGASTPERVPCPPGDGYQLEVADFARAVRAGTAPRWPIDDAVANVAALEALLESARSGRAIEVGAGV